MSNGRPFEKWSVSICPLCFRRVPMRVYEENNVIYLEKTCPEHGKFEDIYWGDAEYYKWFEKNWNTAKYIGSGLENPHSQIDRGCPYDCGICPQHKTHTILGIIDVTNRCVTYDCELILEDGSIVEIGRFVDENLPLDGSGSGIIAKPIRVLSCNPPKPTYPDVIAVHRLKAPNSLVRICTVSGVELKVTPDHEILIDGEYGAQLVRADQLRVGDLIYAPARINVNVKNLPVLELIDDYRLYVYPDDVLMELIRRKAREAYGSLRRAISQLQLKYWNLYDLSVGINFRDFKRLCEKLGIDQEFSLTHIEKVSWRKKTVELKAKYFDEDLAYLIGLIASDGSLSTSRSRGVYTTNFHSTEPELVKKAKHIVEALFPGTKCHVYTDGRGCLRLSFNNLLVYDLIEKVVIEGELKEIFKLPDKCITAFLRGYFDGDGAVSLASNSVYYVTSSRKRAVRIVQLLRRCGILASMHERQGSGFSKSSYYVVVISGFKDVSTFVKVIGSNHPKKFEKLKQLAVEGRVRKIGKSRREIAPRICIKLLAEVINHHRLSRVTLYPEDPSYLSKVLTGKRNTTKTTLRKILSRLRDLELCEKCKSIVQIAWRYSSEDFFLDEVKMLEVVASKDEYVYDITVDKNHLFAANGLIYVSNCNMACPICFAYAGAVNYVYEPTYEQIVGMIKLFRSSRPWAANALQFSGGEPTLRNDLPDLVREAKRAGIRHVEVNTNGIRLAEDLDYYSRLLDAGMDTIYLQFDGLREEIYLKLRGRGGLVDVKNRVIENARKIGHKSIVLVVTLAKGVNDGDLGDIVRYAINNRDVIRCVNIQPISMAGRARKEEMRKMRITIPDAVKLIEEQTNGAVSKWSWRPVNWPLPIAKGMEVVKNRTYPEFTLHPHCGAATFLVAKEDGSFTPITELVDVDNFAQVFWGMYYLGVGGHSRRAKLEALKLLPMVKSELIRNLLKDIITKGSYEALGRLMYNVVMVGIMHFQDVWNLDLDRVNRCGIHYATPDGKIISFCTFNSIHRTAFEEKFKQPIEDWMKKTGKKLIDYA
ncbi:MAG: radical SAM protein [Candidatus Bathyarchaeia archaeon]